jgi:hypothetical protein
MPRIVATTATILFLCASAQAAQEPSHYGKADCRIAPVEPAPSSGVVEWSGACKDGYAQGPGVLEWRVWSKGKYRLEATLARGEASGEGTLTFERGKYIGTFKRGVPHGQGYFEYANNKGWYEGGVVDGKRDGTGIYIAADRSRYEGQWKAGKRHGYGSASFALGGSYQGEWANDRFEGKGSIVYAGSGRKYEGQFVNGRPASAPEVEVAKSTRYTLRGDEIETASKLRPEKAIGPVPFDAGWEALSEEHKNLIREWIPALEPGDKPPYPVHGTAEAYAAIATVYKQFLDHDGSLLLYVLVGKDGTPKSVTAIGGPHPELVRYASMIFMATKFTPAICHGQPCEMIYPASLSFTTN